MIESVFFDLDGTLVDTAPDLAAALNDLLCEGDLPEIPMKKIRPAISLGGNALIKLAFNLDENDEEFEKLRDRFLLKYEQRMHSHSVLFPEMLEVLDQLEKDRITWGIVTNKSSWLTKPLITELNLNHRTACIICGDTASHRKPHPAPMLEACKVSKSNPANSLYVGDAKRDIDAGKAAGMYTMIAKYGYIDESDDINSWRADAIVDTPSEITEWIIHHQKNHE